MTVQCIACTRFTLDRAGSEVDAMGKMGCGRCSRNRGGQIYMTAYYQRECEGFQQSPDEEKRRAWMDRQRDELIRQLRGNK
jgi:hypothetical protein